MLLGSFDLLNVYIVLPEVLQYILCEFERLYKKLKVKLYDIDFIL